MLLPTLHETGSIVVLGESVDNQNSTAPDGFSRAMTAILSAFMALTAAGMSPLVAFLLPAAVVVVIAMIR